MSINDQENSYIHINSLITLNLISDDKPNNKYSKYIVRVENSDDLIAFKLCKKPLFEYLDLTESIFYIRDAEECESIYSNKIENSKISCQELRFLKNDKINQSTQFYLQHMLSSKFISTEINFDNNKIILKLVNDIKNAYLFSFKKINEARGSTELLTFNQIFYLNVFIEEENQFYYICEDELICDEIDNNKQYFDIILHKKAFAKFSLINQTLMIEHPNNIYSGQLTNIIFSYNINGKYEKFMLGVEEKNDLDNKNIINNKEQISKSKVENYKVVPYLYTEELCEHVIKNAFWVIEENNSTYCETLVKEGIKLKEGLRIKNPSTGLYLNVRQRNIAKISNKSNLNETDKNEYEFCLVDNNTLNDTLFFDYNFKFFHYIISEENPYIVDDGKYILKSIYKNFNKEYVFKDQSNKDIFSYPRMENYFMPISINIHNITNFNISSGLKNKNILINQMVSKCDFIIKNEDEFVFNIKKINILKGNEVIFIKKIFLKLEKDLKNQNLNITILNDWFTFLIEYLINLEYSYKDNNHETNIPIKERQILLWKYNVIDIIDNILNYYLNKIKNFDYIENKIQTYKQLIKLSSNILRFLLYLSKEEESIKISIYVLLLNQIVNFAEILLKDELLKDDLSKLLIFIFDLINDSEILQNCLLGDNKFLKNYIEHDTLLSKLEINLNNLIKIDKIFDFIEINKNFWVLYQKLINLNKVQYKSEEILRKIKLHMEQVNYKENNNIEPDKENYIRIIKKTVKDAKLKIKNNALLIDELLNSNNIQPIKTRKTKFRNSIKMKNLELPKLVSIPNNKNFQKEYNSNSNININIKENEKEKEKEKEKKKIINSKISNDITSNKAPIKTIFVDKFSDSENESQIPTIRSVHPLLNNNQDDDPIKNQLNNLGQKETERQFLKEDNKSGGSINERKSFRISSIKSKKGTVINNCSLNNSIKMLSKQIKDDINNHVEKVEKKDEKKEFNDFLKKLGKIWYFIKWYESFDFNDSLFMHEKFLKEIFNDKVKNEFVEKQLFYFLKGNLNSSIFIKDLKINTDSKTGILYLFRLYNTLFPKIYCKFEQKINNNENISGKEIIEDMNEDQKIDPYYESIEDLEGYKQILFEDGKKLDEYLCLFYSSYQFYINQYVRIVHRLFFILSNYFLNSDNFGNLKVIRESFMKTLQILLSKVTFVEENILDFFYSRIIKNPSLLSSTFDLEEIKAKSIQILSNQKKK